jgi:DNA-binding transcriptional ArsR family regulator
MKHGTPHSPLLMSSVKIIVSKAYGKIFLYLAIFCAKRQIYLLNSNTVSKWEVPKMNDWEKTRKILKALAGKSRLQILECIQKGVSNPGEIAKKMKRHRSTIEKHLRVLLAASIVEKVPSLTKSGQLAIRYKIRENANELLVTIQELCQKF